MASFMRGQPGAVVVDLEQQNVRTFTLNIYMFTGQ